MTLNIDLLKKKIIYRSNYRGTKEMDKLLGAFTDKYLDQLEHDDSECPFPAGNATLSSSQLKL